MAIRLGDLCGGLNIDLESEIEKKMEKNRKRGYKHGKAFWGLDTIYLDEEPSGN